MDMYKLQPKPAISLDNLQPARPGHRPLGQFLQILLDWNTQELIKVHNAPAIILRPLLQLFILGRYEEYINEKNSFEPRSDETWSEAWRRTCDDLDSIAQHMRAYNYLLKSYMNNTTVQNTSTTNLEDLMIHNGAGDGLKLRAVDVEFMLSEMREMERRARDAAQVELGTASLQEARKSIEQAQTSIEEGKRVKASTSCHCRRQVDKASSSLLLTLRQ